MKENTEQTKKVPKADIIVISVILLGALLFLLFSLLGKKPGTLVVVEVSGIAVGEYSLSEDGIYILNGGTNTLVIENGEAYLSDANCPDHVCVKTGKIKYVGQTIICLPNRLSVTIKGDGEGGVDLVS